MTFPRILPATDHGSEIALLWTIAVGAMILMGIGLYSAAKSQQGFDPSAYLVVLTLIVGAIKERWLSRSVDRMGQSLAAAPATPPTDPSPPQNAAEGAQDAADAAADRADEIQDQVRS